MGANKGRERGGAGRRNCAALLMGVACASTATLEEYGAPALLTSRQDPCLRADLRSDLGPDVGNGTSGLHSV